MKLSEAVRQKGDGSTYHHCPRCNGNGKLEVTPDGAVFYCHKCKWGGRIDDAKRIVTEVKKGNAFLWEDLKPAGSAQIKYLTDRGFNTNELATLKPMSGPLHMRVYLPVLGTKENVVFALARLIVDRPGIPKYLVPPHGAFLTPGGMPIRKSEIFWGAHRIHAMHRQPIVICEGILSAVKFGHWNNVPSGLALMGKTLSKVQASTIAKHIAPMDITFCFDGDAQEDALKAAKLMSQHYGGPIYNIRLPADNDPANTPDLFRWFHKRERLG